MSSPISISNLFNFYLVLLLLCLSANPAHAYIGPGLSVGGIIVILLVFASLLLAFYAIVWFPIKRRLKAKNESVKEIKSKSESENTE